MGGKDQVENIAAYDKMKSDLLGLSVGITKFLEERRKVENSKKETGVPGNVDLELNMPKHGLGPAALEDLGLKHEDIGLKNPVVLLDYPSPPHSFMSVNQIEQEVKKCRNHCSMSHKNDRGYPLSKISKESSAENIDYLVEFPPDDSDTNVPS